MSGNSAHDLEPPTIIPEDAGAKDLVNSDSEDHFSDAQSGTQTPSIPITRVEKVTDEPSYGEVPGTSAYGMRVKDADPDQVAVIPEKEDAAEEMSSPDRSNTPGGHPIPTTVVEKVDPEIPSYGEVPGTEAHSRRQADAVPDLVLKSDETGSRPSSVSGSRPRSTSTPGDLPIPMTKVEKVDSKPSHGEVPGTDAFDMRKNDAEPDIVKEVGDIQGKSEKQTSEAATRDGEASSNNDADGDQDYDDENDDDNDFGDDFDDFEEGGDDAEFGEFDDGFAEADAEVAIPTQSLPTIEPRHDSPLPIFDFAKSSIHNDILASARIYAEAIFPRDDDESPAGPGPSFEPAAASLLLGDRSALVWRQLVEPPPLQPADWIRSRIRRLFLVSLGVPVDLDEILPASKQKKLVLPSLNLPQSPTHPPSSASPPSTAGGKPGGPEGQSLARLRQADGGGGGSNNASRASVDSQTTTAAGGRASSRSRRRGPPPPPELDVTAARQLCEVTDERLAGMTDAEMGEHVAALRRLEARAAEVLEYWTRRTDERLGDREAFEGVIENLVMHARKVRK